ncbi:MAG: coenzyme F430 synthase, partial [Candidatus Methanoperedens sp.]|nr:coenzyme F430 synthase [Candidatus Methanoperedens sp.]
MQKKLSIKSMLEKKKVAVLDLTHGGTGIALRLRRLCGSVTGVDVYDTLSQEERADLENEGISVSRRALNAGDFEVLVAPVHLDPGYPMLLDAAKIKLPVLSHHDAVREILSGYDLKDKTIIEITGTKAKTSTCILLAEILSREKNVISHTSRGVEDWSNNKIIRKGLSITPASVLEALDSAIEAGIDYQVLISEISLGGTGSADVGVITTISSDYMIANNTKLASEAKRQMIINAKPGSTLVINHDALRFFGACRRDVNIISFSDDINASCNVYYEDISSKGGVIAYYLGRKKGRITITENQ